MEIRRIDWPTTMEWIVDLAQRLQGKKIWGIPRGGQVVATIMAYHGCELASRLGVAEVIIDDIVCTGTTCKAWKMNNSPSLKFATLVTRSTSKVKPDYSVVTFYTSDYIMFPWEDIEKVEKLVAQDRYTEVKDT